MKKTVLLGILFLAIIVVFIILWTNVFGKSSTKKTVYSISPLSGAYAEGGKNARLITEMYFHDHPESKLSVKYVDSESNPTKAVTAINQAIIADKNPLAVSVITSVSVACIPALAEKNGFTIAVCALKTKQFEKFSNYQFLSYDVTDVVGLPAQYLSKNCKSCIVIYSSEEYGLTGATAFKTTFESYGNRVLGMVPYMVGESSTREVVEKALEFGAESIFVVGVTTSGYLNIFRDIKGHGFKGKIASDIVFSSPFIYQALGETAENIVFVCCDCDLTEPRTEKGRIFRNACLSNNMIPYYALVEAYDAYLIMDFIVQKNKEFSQETFVELKQFNGCIGPIDFSIKGEAKYSFCLGTIIDGKITAVE